MREGTGEGTDGALRRFGTDKALRAHPLTSKVRQPNLLPCAVCWVLYPGSACTCWSGGTPRTVPSRNPCEVAAGATPALTRPGLGAARAPAVETGRLGATWLPFSFPSSFFFSPRGDPLAANGPPSHPPPELRFVGATGCSTSEGWVTNIHTYIHTHILSFPGWSVGVYCALCALLTPRRPSSAAG